MFFYLNHRSAGRNALPDSRPATGLAGTVRRTSHLLMLLLLCLARVPEAAADIVKPALVEISINTNGTYHIEVRASIEALLTGINAKYKNTQEAPTAEAYDELRVLQPGDLLQAFEPFKQIFAEEIRLGFDGQRFFPVLRAIHLDEVLGE